MGKIIKINPCIIQPSQDFLKENTFRFIKDNYDKRNFDQLPPTPIVRKDGDNYIAIDGHNLLPFYCLQNMDCEVYVAENKNDAIEGESEMIKKRNQDLFEKYEEVVKIRGGLKKKGINTIKDLCDSVALSGLIS